MTDKEKMQKELEILLQAEEKAKRGGEESRPPTLLEAVREARKKEAKEKGTK